MFGSLGFDHCIFSGFGFNGNPYVVKISFDTSPLLHLEMRLTNR